MGTRPWRGEARGGQRVLTFRPGAPLKLGWQLQYLAVWRWASSSSSLGLRLSISKMEQLNEAIFKAGAGVGIAVTAISCVSACVPSTVLGVLKR